VPEDAYRNELEAAHARIAKLEAELAARAYDPNAARRAELDRSRQMVAALAMPNLTRVQIALSTLTFVSFGLVAATAGMMGEWTWALISGVTAIVVLALFLQTARRRAAQYSQRLALIDQQILALDAPKLPASTQDEPKA
jgi:hypothetical protein